VVGGAIADRAHAMRARESFIAMVSHDLRSPLNAIRMSADLLAKKPAVTLEGVRKHDELVQRSVDRMTLLLCDLLDAAAIDAGRLSVQRHPEDARALVKEAVDASQPLALAKGQTLSAEVVESLPAMCDRGRVLQVLSNLIGNAIKFTEKSGVIKVRAERVERM